MTGRSWRGTAFGGARGQTDIPKIVDWYMEGKIEIDPMITHTMPLDQINHGFDLMHEGKSIRAVVEYSRSMKLFRANRSSVVSSSLPATLQRHAIAI